MNKIDVQGVKRSYSLVFPPNMNKKSPLIIALHGFSGNAKTIELISGLSELAEKNNFFVAYPNGYGTGLFYSWNAKFCCGNAWTTGSNDVLFIESLIKFLLDTQPIDPNRIIITGISNGAMMVNRLGIELGSLIHGIVPIAGSIGTTFPKSFQPEISSYPLDVIIIHGVKDTFIPYAGGKGIKEKDPHHFLPVKEQVRYWCQVNGFTGTPITESFSNNQVIKETYNCEKTKKKVIFYALIKGTHSWPGGAKSLQLAGEPVPKTIFDASQIIVNYFILGKE